MPSTSTGKILLMSREAHDENNAEGDFGNENNSLGNEGF